MSRSPASQSQSPWIVTGASGFVGACVARYFHAQGKNVIAWTGTSGQNWRLEGSGLRTMQVDLTSRDQIAKAIREIKPAVFINMAAYGAYSSQTDSDRIYQVNFESVRHILEALKAQGGLEAFIQAGSSSEYGLNCTAPAEDTQTIPDSEYAVSKVAATALTQFYGKKHSLPAWVFRLYAVYGPYEESSRLIPKLLAHAAQGKLPPLVDPTISRDFIYVDDVCRAIEACVAHADTLPKGEVYNIGSGHKTTLKDLVEVARSAFDIREEPKWGSMEARRWDHADWYSNPTKAARDLGWSAKTSLTDGLKTTFRWMKENADAVTHAEQNSILHRKS